MMFSMQPRRAIPAGVGNATGALAVAAILAIGSSAFGQAAEPIESTQVQPYELQPVDMRVQDTGVLSRSFRVIPQGLQVPGDFSQVYQLPSGHYFRAQGGIFAVFPQSSYVQTDGGEVPLIPAGTVFHIGPPQDLVDPSTAGPRPLPPGSELVRWDTRIGAMPADLNRNIEDGVSIDDAIAAIRAQSIDINAVEDTMQRRTRIERVDQFEAIERSEDAEPSPAIAGDAAYRAQRLKELMSQAAEAEAERRGSD